MVAKKLQQPGAMKVWKSPVLYFGVLLVAAVIALLLAPVIVNWNGYRGDLEAYGQKLTGRSVTVEGPISARLFPWPRFTAENVRIASPSGMAAKDFATISRITVRMTLAGLLQGGIDVESIDVEDPDINLERLASGEGNWQFTPSADLMRSDILSRVRLDKITVTGGTLTFHDRRLGDAVTLDDINADVASPGVAGPWRLRARALYDDRPVEIAVNTAAYAEGQPFLFGVKFQSADNSGYVYSFDGAYKEGRAEGDLQVAPAQSEDGKGDAEGQLRRLTLSAKAKGNFDALELSDIQVARDDPGEAGAIATGSAALRLGHHIEAEADLSASMLDLDALAGAKSRDLLRQAGSLAVLDSLLALLPRDMSLDGSVKVTSLKTGGQTLDNVVLAVSADRDRLRIGRLSSGLPGRTQVLFTGNYFPAPGGGELAGDLALDTADLREFTLWLWQGGQASLGPMWTGNRGRLKMQTGVSLTPAGMRLDNTDFELDGERGKASLAVTSAGRGAVDLDVEGGHFDLDSYAPQGIPAFQAAARQGAGGILDYVLPRPDAPDLRLKLKADELQMNAVTARDVAIDLQSGVNGLDLRALNIGAVGGASVAASGLVLDNGKGADGTISLEVKADDPGGLIRLMGFAGSDGLPPWARDLGATALRADLAVKPGDKGSAITLQAGGTAGQLTVSASGTVAPDKTLTGQLRLDAPGSGRILALLGLAEQGPDQLPGAIAIDATGSVTAGFAGTATLQALGGRLDYQGGVSPLAEGYGVKGKLSLRATDVTPLAAAAGLPVAGGMTGVLVLDAPVAWADGAWSFTPISGRLGTTDVSGEVSLTPERVIAGRVQTGELRLRDLLAATFLGWSGSSQGLETGFATELPFGLTGELWVAPKTLVVHPNFTAGSAEIGIEAKPGDIHLAMHGKDGEGRDALVELGSTGSDESRKLSGRLVLPVDLARQLALADGGPVASGDGSLDIRFTSEGRSPGAALAAATGQGQFALEEFRLAGVTPAAFTAALAAAKDSDGIASAFSAMRDGTGLDFGTVSGSIDIRGGEMTFSPLAHSDGDADVSVKTVADLAQGELDMEAGIALKARPSLPVMSIAYAGPPMALVRSEDNSELATSLGVTIMREGITELERLQQEQARLAKLEDQQRAEDEARLQAYYAQRDELLLRKRELKVQGEMQVMEADRLRRQIEAERAANTEINRTEMRQRLRELRTWRKLAKLSEAPPKPVPQPQSDPERKTAPDQKAVPEQKAEAAATPAPAPQAEPQPQPQLQVQPRPAAPPQVQPKLVPQPQAQPKPRLSSPPTRKPVKVKPVILAKPPGAPVVISPEPNFSPSQ